mmetsp:Transcript_23927/g.62385  ORF Transcript_23927/g.62385 Transcript_23927/m.62385 type:complete len:396 (-) Transcript_23927:75-1262(-)
MAATRILVALAVAQGFQSKPRLQPRKLSALKSVAEKANYAVVGCGLPSRGMGWFHGLQLVEGACASARLSDVVEPWFLGPGKDSDAGAEFDAGVVQAWPDARFSDAISDETWSTAGPGPKVALIAGRTVDNPGFFRQALEAGATHILLEKPGAPSVKELEAMAAEAKAANVPVFMGFIKNISPYFTEALEVAHNNPGALVTLTSRNDYAKEDLAECFERNAEGLLKNMAIHEIALACQFWGMRADNVVDVICNPKGGKDSPGCDMRTLGGKTDFASVDITLVNSSGTKVRISADRCSGDGCCATVTDTSNGVVLYQQEMVGGERAKKVAAEAKAHPDWFSYLYTQAEEYAKLKGVCAAHALAGTTPPGVATIEIACEALKLAEWLTPELQKKLKK